MTVIVLYLLLILLSLSAAAFFSGTETGLISLNSLRVKELAEEGNSSAAYLDSILESPDVFLSVTLADQILPPAEVFPYLFRNSATFLKLLNR